MRPIHVVRYVIPAVVIAAGVVLIFATGGRGYGPDALSALAGAGGAIYLINSLLRMGGEGDHQRDVEDVQRRFLDRYGLWPDEAPEGWRSPEGRDVRGALESLYLEQQNAAEFPDERRAA